MLRTPGVIATYIVSDLRNQYRTGNRHIKAKFAFPLSQLNYTLTSSSHDTDDVEMQRARKQAELDGVFQPLFESMLDCDTLIGKVTIEIASDDNCVVTAKYQVKTPQIA